MRKKKSPFVTIVLFILAVTITFTSCEKKPKTLTKVTVRLKWAMLAHVAAGEVIAKEKGYFEDEGLDVELRPGGLELDAIRTVPSGNDDIGVTSPDQIIIARGKGIPVKAFFLIIKQDPVCFFAKKESGITSFEDFPGHTVGVKYGTNVEVEYEAIKRKMGLTSAEIKEVPAKFDMAPFFNDKVDVWSGYAINEPILAKQQGYEVNIIYPKDYGISWYGNLYFATDDYYKDNKNILSKYLNGVKKGWLYALEHPEETVRLLKKYNPKIDTVHQVIAMKELKDYIDTSESFGFMDVQIWGSIQKELLEQGIIEDTLMSTTFFTNELLDNKN